MKRSVTKYRYIILAAILFSLVLGHGAFALELKYPNIPGAPPLTSDTGLLDYIQYLFILAISVAGIIAVISLAIGGVQILASAGNPSAISDARDRLFSTILGIVLLLLCVVILRTINPNLVNQKFDVAGFPSPEIAIPPGGGIFPPLPYNPINPFAAIPVYAQSSQFPGYTFIEAPEQVDDLRETFPPGSYFLYPCTSDIDEISPDIFFFGYQVEFADDSDINADVQQVGCNQAIPLDNFSSYKWDYLEEGIYFFLEPDCQGTSTNAIRASKKLPEEFQNKVQSACIINGNGKDSPKYGFVLHTDENFNGSCTLPFQNLDSSRSVNDPSNNCNPSGPNCFNIATCQASSGSTTTTFTPTPTTPSPTPTTSSPTPTTSTPVTPTPATSTSALEVRETLP